MSELKELLVMATRSTQDDRVKFRSSEQECFGDHDAQRILDTYPNFGSYYEYFHWNIEDAYTKPNCGLSQIYQIYYRQALEDFYRCGIRPGDCILRVVRYHKMRPFVPHKDIDFRTTFIGAVSEDLSQVKIVNSTYSGMQAELLELGKAHIHRFNANKMKYSFVFLANAHFSVRFPKGGTVASLLNNTCYKND